MGTDPEKLEEARRLAEELRKKTQEEQERLNREGR